MNGEIVPKPAQMQPDAEKTIVCYAFCFTCQRMVPVYAGETIVGPWLRCCRQPMSALTREEWVRETTKRL